MKKFIIEDPQRLFNVIDRVLDILKDIGFGQCSYGFFLGGDPRDFTPDPESTTEEEYMRWKADCEAFARGEKGPTPTSCSLNIEYSPPGTIVVTKSFYGQGISLNTEEQAIFIDLFELKRLLKIAVRERHEP